MSRQTQDAEALQMKELSEMVRKALAVDNVVLITSKWEEGNESWEQMSFYNQGGVQDIPTPHIIRMLMQALVQLMLENRNPTVTDDRVMNTMFSIFHDIYKEMKNDIGDQIDEDRTPGRNIH